MYDHVAYRRRAEKLRKDGLMYAEIAEELGIAKSTAYSWVKHVQMSASKLHLIEQKKEVLQSEKIRNLAVINKRRHQDRNKEIENKARAVVSNLILDDHQSKLLCAIFFWCEGGKDARGGIQFINSDPVMIATFLHLLRKSFSLDEAKFRGLMHLHEYHDEARQLKYWSQLTNIPTSQFYKSYIKPNTGKNYRVNYPGCISIRYADGSLGKLLQMIYTEFGNQYRGVR